MLQSIAVNTLKMLKAALLLRKRSSAIPAKTPAISLPPLQKVITYKVPAFL